MSFVRCTQKKTLAPRGGGATLGRRCDHREGVEEEEAPDDKGWRIKERGRGEDEGEEDDGGNEGGGGETRGRGRMG